MSRTLKDYYAKTRRNEKANYFNSEATSNITFLIHNRRYDEAIVAAENYMAAYPHDDLAPFYLAKAFNAKGEHKKALELTEKIYYLNHFYNKSTKQLATSIFSSILMDNGRYDEAVEILEQVIAEDPGVDNYKIRCDYIKMLTTNREFEKALLKVNEVLRKKRIASLVQDKGRIQYLLGDYRNALDTFLSIDTVTDQKYIEEQNLNYYIGRSYYQLSKENKHRDFELLTKAESYLQKALSTKNFVYYSTCNELAALYNTMERPEAAITYANQVIENKHILNNEEKLANCYERLSMAYIKQGKFDRALEAIEQIEVPLYHELGLVRYYFNTKQYEEYLKHINYVLSNVNENGITIHLQEYISVLLKLGRYDEALYKVNCLKKEVPYSFYECVYAYVNKMRGNEPTMYKNYSSNQIANYSLEEAAKHIWKNHIYDDSTACFTSEVEATFALLEAKAAIKNLDCTPNGIFDKYLIVKEGVGVDKYGRVNGMVAIVAPDTTDIITLYPVSHCCVSDYEEEYTSKNVKRLSQIEKFNQKYGKK